jgi:hypothetical protein
VKRNGNQTHPPLSMRPPAGLEGADGSAIDVVIVEWQQPGQPVEPNEEHHIDAC